MDNIVDDFLNSLQSHIPSLEEEWEGDDEIFQEQKETINFMNSLNLMSMGTDA